MKSSKEWISISDMMTGLMMIFLFISVVYMEQSRKPIDNYFKNKNSIYQKLHNEFDKDLKKWNAMLLGDSLVIRFLNPKIMFNPGESAIKLEFKKILSDFCPRYLKLLHSFLSVVDEIRIEGHTSKEWRGLASEDAYFKNMKLSQDRTRSALKYCVKTESSPKIRKWAVRRLTANGLSSSRPLCIDEDTPHCKKRNRRVDFGVYIKPIANSLSERQSLSFKHKKSKNP